MEDYFKLVGGYNSDGVAVNMVVCDNNEDFCLEIVDDGIARQVVELLNKDLREYEASKQ